MSVSNPSDNVLSIGFSFRMHACSEFSKQMERMFPEKEKRQSELTESVEVAVAIVAGDDDDCPPLKKELYPSFDTAPESIIHDTVEDLDAVEPLMVIVGIVPSSPG